MTQYFDVMLALIIYLIMLIWMLRKKPPTKGDFIAQTIGYWIVAVPALVIF